MSQVNKGEGLVMRGGFWPTTSCSHASSNAINTTDRVVSEPIPHRKSRRARTFEKRSLKNVMSSDVTEQYGLSLGTGATDAL